MIYVRILTESSRRGVLSDVDEDVGDVLITVLEIYRPHCNALLGFNNSLHYTPHHTALHCTALLG